VQYVREQLPPDQEPVSIGAGDTRVHTVTVRPRDHGKFAVTSTNFSYRDEYGTPVRTPEFQAGLTVLPVPPSAPSAPAMDIDVVSEPLAPGEWDELRLRVRSGSPSTLRGITLTVGGPIRIADPGSRVRLPDLAEGQEAEASFIVCPTAAGRQVPAHVVVNYTDGSGRARVQNQPLPLVVSSPSSPERGRAVAPDGILSREMPSEGKHPVLVLTALDLEYQAVREHLTGLREHRHPQGTLFETGQLSGGGEIAITLTGEGNVGAAVLSERAMSMFGPQAMLFVGVAGALKDDIELGDVVVATRVYAYHGSKEEDDGVWTRPRSWEASHELEQFAHSIARARSWGEYLPRADRGRLPAVHFKPIAAGEVLLATWRGATVLSTTRQAGRLALLKEHGVDHPLLDTGEVAPAVRELYPDGVDAALDLIGTPTLPDTLRAVRVHGTACFGGSLSGQYTVRDFSPNEYLPKGVRLAGYFGDAADLPAEAFQEILDAVAAGRLAFPVDRVYDGLEQVPQAHDDMEHDRATGKLVVRVRH
jgi:hypothetical protein